MGELRFLSKNGDTKVIWNPDNKDEVKAARNQFDELKDKKFKAFEVDKEGNKGKQIYRFNEKAGRIIMVPPLAGG